MWSEECEEAFGKLKEYLTNPLFGSIPLGGKLGTSKRRFGNSETCLLHE
jgi:hypothetical protein